MDKQIQIQEFFVEKIENGVTYFALNEKLSLQFKSDEEATQFFVEVIRFWQAKVRLFCRDNFSRWNNVHQEFQELPEEKWIFIYNSPSSNCSYCSFTEAVIKKIYGSLHKFNHLIFVYIIRNCKYSVSYEDMKYFASNGFLDYLYYKREIWEKDSELSKEQILKLRGEQNAKLKNKLGNAEISEELMERLLPYADNKSLVVVNRDIAVVMTPCSEYIPTIDSNAHLHQVHVFYGHKTAMLEWKYSVGNEPSDNKPWLMVDGIGEVWVKEEKHIMNVKVELINNQHDNRVAHFRFDKIE